MAYLHWADEAQVSLAMAALGGCDGHHESAFTVIGLR
jgi:hypothetical protein